jgi:hypothetical protein
LLVGLAKPPAGRLTTVRQIPRTQGDRRLGRISGALDVAGMNQFKATKNNLLTTTL